MFAVVVAKCLGGSLFGDMHSVGLSNSKYNSSWTSVIDSTDTSMVLLRISTVILQSKLSENCAGPSPQLFDRLYCVL